MKRYHMESMGCGIDAIEDEEGKWCKHEDFDALLTQCEEAIKKHLEYRDAGGGIYNACWDEGLSAALAAIRAAREDSHDK